LFVVDKVVSTNTLTWYHEKVTEQVGDVWTTAPGIIRTSHRCREHMEPVEVPIMPMDMLAG